jgi:hypothetical protein
MRVLPFDFYRNTDGCKYKDLTLLVNWWVKDQDRMFKDLCEVEPSASPILVKPMAKGFTKLCHSKP